MQNCSLRRRMLLVLCALMLLPVVSAFAANNTFKVNVGNLTIGPVASATVYIWDKNNPFNWQSGVTGTNGEVLLSLNGLTPTADSLTNPSPNIGVLALPTNGVSGTLAFGTGEALFYNFWNEDAFGPDVFVDLKDGCKLTIAPKLVDGTAVTPGMAQYMQVHLPGVPWQVKIFTLSSGDLVNGAWQIVWPFDSVVNYSLSGDNDFGMFDKPSFYSWMSDSVIINREAEKLIEPRNVRNYKGQFSVNTGTASSAFQLAWTQAGDINFTNAVISPTYFASASIFLPKGLYNVKYIPEPFQTAVRPPIVVFPVVNIGDQPIVQNVSVTGGDAVNGVVTLANGGSANALGALKVVAQKKVTFGGSDSWIEVESLVPSTTDGSYAFRHRFVSGQEYRIFTQNANQYDYKPGIIDTFSVPAKCYTHVVPANVVTTGDRVFNIQLPQAAAVAITVGIPSGNTDAGFAKDTNGSYLQPMVAYMPTVDSNYGQRTNDFMWSGNTLFIPFAQVGRPFFARFDYDQSYADLTNPICIKISDLFNAEPGITKQISMGIDPANFETVVSNLLMPGGSVLNKGMARALFSPLIPFNGKQVSAAEMLGQYIVNGYGLDNKVFTVNDTNAFVFKAENGKAFRLVAIEETNPKGLEGFLPFSRDIVLPQTDPSPTTPVQHDMLVDEGRSFFGQLKVDGTPVGNVPVKVMINTIFDDNFQNMGEQQIHRESVVTTDPMGGFRVSGITPGRYDVDLILDPIDFASPSYNIQRQPVLNRKVYVDETATTNAAIIPGQPTPLPTTIAFNLNTSAFGWLDGQIVDEKGQPVIGARVEISTKGELKTYESEKYSYYQKGKLVFLCMTDQTGRIVRPVEPGASAEMAMIPLENGSYDIFVAGINMMTASFSYDINTNEVKPLANVQIFANNQKTPVRITLKRKFPVIGVITEAGVPVKYAGCQVMDMEGKSIAYFMTNDKGEYRLEGGLVPGKVQYGLVIEAENGRKFYLEEVTVVADQVNVLNLNLIPTSLANVQIQTVDSTGAVLGEAPGSVFLFSNPELGFRAPHWYITWVQSDLKGNINLSLPALSSEELMASFTYVFQGQQKWVSVTDPATNKTISRTFVPPPVVPLKVPSTEILRLEWKAPVNVTINASNIPVGREGRYLGVLMTSKKFLAGRSLDPHQSMPTMGDTVRDTFFATVENGKFVFDNVVPGPEYIFMAYEAGKFLAPEVVEWANDFPEPVMFRYLSAPFMVAANLARSEALWPLAPLNVTCTQAPEILAKLGAVNVAFTPDPVSTVGNVSWPLVAAPQWTTMPPLAFPIEVPASFALRITYTPVNGEGFLAKSYENFVVPTGGRGLDIVLNELPKVSGTVSFEGQPVSGQLVLVPEGVDPMESDFKPIRVPVSVGSFSAYLKPGLYIGYAVPLMGPAKYIEIPMASASMVMAPISIVRGVPVKGTVLASGTPLLGSSVIVMRKRSPVSELTDGQKMWPYPAMMGNHEIPCGPMGEFFFPAEDGVDYYIQAIVPAGFNPGRPAKVRVASSPVDVTLHVGQGGMIKGHMNVPGYVEAVPVGTSAFSGQFGTASSFYADAMIPVMIDGVERYRFALIGLDPNMLYDISFWPMDGAFSYRKFTNVPVPVDPNAPEIKVDLNAGFKITGQLVDASGNPLSAAGVSVNLAMTLAATGEFYSPTASSTLPSYRMMKSITTSPSTADYSLQNSILTGLWTETNQYGQFTFNNVPPFLNAFIKNEKGFSVDGVSYGRGRTDNFLPNFVNSVMHFDVKIPVGGKIIGRLIDEAGKPVTGSFIEAYMGQEWSETQVGTDGGFALDGLAPGADYMVSLMDMPGFTPVYRVGVLVEPGKTTDLGALVVAKAVMAYGSASGTLALMKRSFAYGLPEGTELILVGLDGNKNLTDDDLLTRGFMQSIIGESELYLSPGDENDQTWFSMFTKAGKTNFGVVLHRETKDGIRTMLSWGWRTGVVVPTAEQLEFGEYEITTGTTPIMFPQKFGVVEGSLKHAVDASATFNPADAVIAFYPVVASGTDFVLVPTPFPTALTSAVNGRWLVKDIPQGMYRIKVITRKYGTIFSNKIVTVGDTLVTEDLALGNSVVKITGKVLVEGTTTPVDSARVTLVLKNLSTSTDATGNFAFYLPINDLLIPQLEIAKPGHQTKRILNAGGIATSGAVIASDTNLGNLTISNAVGSVEVTVKSAKDSKIYVGAEVALVYKESETNLVWTVGETRTTDENGLARFLSVPTGKVVSFRARAHYHVPTIASTTVSAGLTSLTITMPTAAPKVFYTGVVEPNVSDPTQLKLRAMFDFNQVVAKTDIGLLIADQQRITDCAFPDLIGGRITNMSFNNLVPNQDNLVASVTHLTFGSIGRFEIVGKALFTKEYEVDPLSQDGFSGYQTDSTGNKLPTGIAVPPGYLDPTIDSFNLAVASPTINPDDKLEGTDSAPEFAGPTFSFTFGQGQSNFAAGTATETKGLFEITIAYTEGTKLEPRWYDTTRKIWSKVGIIQESIRYDYPQKGYVTFKVDHLTEFTVLKNVANAASGLRCNFTNDSDINDFDLAALIAMNQLKNAGVDASLITLSAVQSVAGNILPGSTFTVSALPSAAVDDLNSDGALDDSDLAYLIGWIQLKNAGVPVTSITETSVKSVAAGILSSVKGSLSKFPGETVTR